MHYVLGAPGSGKSSLAPLLRTLLPGRVVLDWDALMEPAGTLAGWPVREHPDTWGPYSDLVRAVVGQLGSSPVVLLTVCTPDELRGWPPGRWLLLDCDDTTRRTRLAPRGDLAEATGAVADAASYRALGLPVVDTTSLPLPDAARRLAAALAGSDARGDG
ncbi:P-loop NTPase family protein [Auraticoccus monumenti]|uniref:AAA domain-containing protein n=1 Tax=Auraticoccus monumenti TaxID=675864 RepID=A0A1G7BVG1_9ACTN|nr:hypothetical protein [Auraticoccus monumenti]SDE30993.1 hypothetical protein SAMN04489747_3080 [Auraticoccus monumenti]